MYTVLLADDEKVVTDSLQSSIPWAELGVETILTANDGLQALQMLSAIHIDLLVTDIRMPHMDGLTLLEHVRKHYPHMHCILITAYGEFEYAMKALKLGVDNYIMKPIPIRELTETVENALDNIYANRKNRETLFRENILHRWITGSISSDELGERSVLIDVNVYQPQYCVITARKEDKTVSISHFGQICMGHFSEAIERFSLWDNQGQYVILTGGSSIHRQELSDVMEHFVTLHNLHGRLRISVGPVVYDRMEVPVSYQQACDLLQTWPFPDQKTIRLCSDAKSIPGTVPLIDTDSLSPVVARSLEYIREHFAEGVSIKEFCAQINVNASYLGYLFKKETGMFFNHYLNECRMEKAMELLVHSGEKINDIALLTGFATTSHFITTFKKKTGLSPLKYRETYGGSV